MDRIIEYENLKKVNLPFMDQYREAFNRVMESGWYILGESVRQFEQEFADYCGTRYCCGVANGLDALILALKSFGLEDGDEVLVPSNTYIATILAIVHNRLKPVLIEPDIRTYNMDPHRMEEKISSRTKAVLVVHLYGKLCDMEAIGAIAKKHDLRIVEDCAQAHGASFKGRKAGAFGDFGAFSFYPTKNLGALADAGALTTNEETLFQQVQALRNYGSQKKYYNEVVGFNSRLDEMQAAFLSIKLAWLDRINEHKRKLAGLYLNGLKQDFIKPLVQEDYYDVYHIFNVRHEKRDALREYLAARGVKTEIHYPVAPRDQKAMKGILDDQPSPLAEEIHATTLSLPVSFFHTENDVTQIIGIMNAF